MQITLKGMEDVEKQLKRIERGTQSMGRYYAYVGSRLPYAYGIHQGRHRVSGKLARRAGGAMYLSNAVGQVLSDADRDLAEGLNKVTAPGVWVLKRLGLWTRRIARQIVPRGPKKKGHSYRLYRSIHYGVGRVR